MTQKYPLPITNAMLQVANTRAQFPRYDAGGNTADWSGGLTGNEVNVATAKISIANMSSADIENQPRPYHQADKAARMVPPVAEILADIGKDYGTYAGLAGRTGTIGPRDPYPAVKP